MKQKERDDIKAQHVQRITTNNGNTTIWEDCAKCRQPWPCFSLRALAHIERLEKGLSAILEEHIEVPRGRRDRASQCCVCLFHDDDWPCATFLEARAALRGSDGNN